MAVLSLLSPIPWDSSRLSGPAVPLSGVVALTPLPPIPWQACALAVTIPCDLAVPWLSLPPGVALTRLSPSPGPGAAAFPVGLPGTSRFAEALRNSVALWVWGVPGDPHPSALVPDSAARKEREVMLRLKEVVDRQRDELRAQAHEIVCKSRDTEALQEQLHRFMAMNEELRHKVAVVQAQLKSALEHKSDLEAAMLQSQRETSRRSRTGLESRQPEPGSPDVGLLAHPDMAPQHQDGDRSPAHCCFSKEELQQILQERNELKTNLFLVQEELAYYQRELLNEERIPSFFLNAMKSNIKKQRKKIRAKMLGTTEESASSFGLWYQGSSKDPPTSSCSGTWEIIDSLDAQPEPEGESKAGSSSPDRAMAPL
uniref:Rab interacting lysosomal protein n=1 Tax=Ficedula albicollis TaxID=59894 RepID=A0A803VKG5_FICAL